MNSEFYDTLIALIKTAVNNTSSEDPFRLLLTPSEPVKIPKIDNSLIYVNIVQGDNIYNSELSTTRTSAYNSEFTIRLMKGYKNIASNEVKELETARFLQDLALEIRKSIRPKIANSLITEITTITSPDVETIEGSVVIDINLIVKYRLSQ